MVRSNRWDWTLPVALAALASLPVVGAEPASPAAAPIKADEAMADRDAGRERNRVYRYDPLTGTLVAVPPDRIRPGAIYSRFDASRGRWVWSKAAADGSLQYAIGPGSVQQVRYFDLQGSQAEQRRALEKQAPELARLLTIQGARPTLELDDQGRWKLGPTPHVSTVFDESTGQRWEWHHDRPSAVVHSCGPLWMYSEGGYVPVR